jgi:peptidoglycan hydrolase-like protein with peptidoglycan-binding domain
MRGTDVKVIQGVAGIKPDGIFGPGTERAVVVMQKNLGLVPDGIVGPGTWAKVDSILAFLSKQ